MIQLRTTMLADLAGTYRVCLGTGNNGLDASDTYSDPDLLGHVYVGAYLAGHAELARVAVDEQGVAGYVLGALDTRDFSAWCETHWWPDLRERYPLGSSQGPDAELVHLIHSPERVPEAILDEFPSHLHIDLLPRAQGQGLGRTLVDGLLDRLRTAGSTGIHLGVGADNFNAIAFYGRLGFDELAREPGVLYMGRHLT